MIIFNLITFFCLFVLMDTDSDSEETPLIDERFQIGVKLGHGSFGDIYKSISPLVLTDGSSYILDNTDPLK